MGGPAESLAGETTEEEIQEVTDGEPQQSIPTEQGTAVVAPEHVKQEKSGEAAGKSGKLEKDQKTLESKVGERKQTREGEKEKKAKKSRTYLPGAYAKATKKEEEGAVKEESPGKRVEYTKKEEVEREVPPSLSI